MLAFEEVKRLMQSELLTFNNSAAIDSPDRKELDALLKNSGISLDELLKDPSNKNSFLKVAKIWKQHAKLVAILQKHKTKSKQIVSQQ